MLRIWEKFINKDSSLDPHSKIKDVYADIHNMRSSWIHDEGHTVQEWVDICCDNLEKEGHDLNETDVELVKNKFVEYEIKIQPPLEYTQLQEALEQENKTLLLMTEFKADSNVLDQLQNTISLLSSKMKELS